MAPSEAAPCYSEQGPVAVLSIIYSVQAATAALRYFYCQKAFLATSKLFQEFQDDWFYIKVVIIKSIIYF